MPVYVIHRIQKFIIEGKQKIPCSTPGDFLSLIAGAEYVVSNSFHGSVFSIIFNKKFFSYASGDRVVGLLTELGLKERLIRQNNIGNIDDFVDWVAVNQKCEEIKNKSVIFLKNAIG